MPLDASPVIRALQRKVDVLIGLQPTTASRPSRLSVSTSIIALLSGRKCRYLRVERGCMVFEHDCSARVTQELLQGTGKGAGVHTPIVLNRPPGQVCDG